MWIGRRRQPRDSSFYSFAIEGFVRRDVTFRGLPDTNRGAVLDQRAKMLDADGSHFTGTYQRK